MDLLRMTEEELRGHLAATVPEHWWQLFERGHSWLILAGVVAAFCVTLPKLPEKWRERLWRWPWH